MKKIILLCLLSLGLFAQNPKVYSALGDTIYNNIENIQYLKRVAIFNSFHLKIDNYIKDVSDAKKFGFAVESGERESEQREYLTLLRKLSKENEYFKRSVSSTFKAAIETKNSPAFIGVVNSGMLDTKKNRVKITTYYKQHSDEIDATGIIQEFLDEDYAKKHKKKWKPKTKAQLKAIKIKRLREQDKLKQEALEKKLSDELEIKKEKIREDQERELFN